MKITLTKALLSEAPLHKGAISYVTITMLIFSCVCENNKLVMKSSPGISLVFNYIIKIKNVVINVNRAVTKISSCWVRTTSRRGIKQLEFSFASIFLLFSYESSQMQCLARGNPRPTPLNDSPGYIVLWV